MSKKMREKGGKRRRPKRKWHKKKKMMAENTKRWKINNPRDKAFQTQEN